MCARQGLAKRLPFSAPPKLDSSPVAAFCPQPLGFSLTVPFPVVPLLIVAAVNPSWVTMVSQSPPSFRVSLPSPLATGGLDKNKTLTMSRPSVSKVKVLQDLRPVAPFRFYFSLSYLSLLGPFIPVQSALQSISCPLLMLIPLPGMPLPRRSPAFKARSSAPEAFLDCFWSELVCFCPTPQWARPVIHLRLEGTCLHLPLLQDWQLQEIRAPGSVSPVSLCPLLPAHIARYWPLGSSVVLGAVAVKIGLGYATVTQDPKK